MISWIGRKPISSSSRATFLFTLMTTFLNPQCDGAKPRYSQPPWFFGFKDSKKSEKSPWETRTDSWMLKSMLFMEKRSTTGAGVSPRWRWVFGLVFSLLVFVSLNCFWAGPNLENMMRSRWYSSGFISLNNSKVTIEQFFEAISPTRWAPTSYK